MKTLCQIMIVCLIVGTSLACQRSSSESIATDATETPTTVQQPSVQTPVITSAPKPVPTPNPMPAPEKLLNYDELVNGETPENLADKLEIRNYQFEKTRIENRPEVQLEVFNVSQDETLKFEIRTLFFRDSGSVIDASKWVKASAPARKSYKYRALTFSPYADKEMVQLRNVETVPSP